MQTASFKLYPTCMLQEMLLREREKKIRKISFCVIHFHRYYDVNIGIRRRNGHADHASMSGIHAAQNMLGAQKPYDYQPVEFGALAGIEWEGTGLLDSRLDTVSFFDESHGDGLERGVVYYLEDGGIVGVLTVNLPNRMDYAKKLVKFAFPIEEAGLKDTMQMIYLGEKN